MVITKAYQGSLVIDCFIKGPDKNLQFLPCSRFNKASLNLLFGNRRNLFKHSLIYFALLDTISEPLDSLEAGEQPLGSTDGVMATLEDMGMYISDAVLFQF